MCIICEDWESGQLSSRGAFRALGNAIKATKNSGDKLHFMEACDRIVREEVPEPTDDLDYLEDLKEED